MVVVGLILSCGHDGGGAWFVVIVVVRLFFGWSILGKGL